MVVGLGRKHRFHVTEKVHDTWAPQSVIDRVTPFFVDHQPRVFQDSQMLGNGGGVHSDHLGKFAHAAFPFF